MGSGDLIRNSYNIHIPEQGYSGGIGVASGGGGGGGGGAGGVGEPGGRNGAPEGNGGIGIQINITGNTYYYSDGGGGGHGLTTVGGSGGGGYGQSGGNGTNATYSGGGGGGGGGSWGSGGDGYEGIVIIKSYKKQEKKYINNSLQFDNLKIHNVRIYKNPNILYDIIHSQDGRLYGVGSINKKVLLLKQENYIPNIFMIY